MTPRPWFPLLVALFVSGCAGSGPATVADAPAPHTSRTSVMSADNVFLDSLQHRTFRWFWDTTDPATGLTPDRWPTRAFSSVAAIGFGMTSYGIGAENGWVTRRAAAERTLTSLKYLWNAPQNTDQVAATGYKGHYYHFLNYDTGTRFGNVELSSIDTGLLMMGVLFTREYFDGNTAPERDIRAYADSLYQRVEWDWFQAQSPLVTMAWRPEVGFGPAEYEGYNEAMFLYVLGMGSPTYPLSGDAWEAFTSSYNWAEFYGQEHLNFSPLFGHQYTASWVDLRGIQDAYMRSKGIDYFENGRRATLSQQAYAIDNPGGFRDYSAEIWGLTACDGPADVTLDIDGVRRAFRTYAARGASDNHIVDDGTIAPTATGGSIVFAPEIVVPTLRAMADKYGGNLYTRYGFVDAFNPTFTAVGQNRKGTVTEQGWFDEDYLGIDQGPILLMIENYRSGLIWEMMKKSPYVVRGLRRAGFTGGWLDEARVADPPIVIGARMPEPEDEQGFRNVVILGSSTAEGAGPAHSDSTWANRLRALLRADIPEARVVNLARGGFQTSQLLPTGTAVPEGRPQPDPQRNVTAALAKNPVAVIINMPSNDTAAGVSLADQEAYFEAITGPIEAAGIPYWVTTTQPRNFPDAEQRAMQTQMSGWILRRFGDRAVDVWSPFATGSGGVDPRWDSGDGVHLNDAAHRILFSRIAARGILLTLATAH